MGFQFERLVSDRWDVFDVIASKVQDRRVLYLEFGVSRAAPLGTGHPSSGTRRPGCHGFDSFEELPEVGQPCPGADLQCWGEIPVIDDPRVQFFKGWFDQVLPNYVVPEHDVLVLIMDADLYSSTACVLRRASLHRPRDSDLLR